MSRTETYRKQRRIKAGLCLIIILELIAAYFMTMKVYALSDEHLQTDRNHAAVVQILSAMPVVSMSANAAAAPLVYEEEHRWKGPVLSKGRGTITGPSGKETYYNLNMGVIVNMMHSRGVEGEYWVREDGVKMLGDYVMVAANLNVHPRGSLVETSLGTAMVCDTGGFAKRNPYQLDIAVAW